MKWYSLEDRPGKNAHEEVLYNFLATRPGCFVLPPTRPGAGDWQAIPYGSESAPGDLNWDPELSDTEIETLLQGFSKLLPKRAKTIREEAKQLREMLPLRLSRTGPACPEIVRFPSTYVVREGLKRQLEGVDGLKFLEAQLDSVVPLPWELGQPVPAEFLDHDPKQYVRDGQHSPEACAQIGQLYELMRPEGRWFLAAEAPRTPDWVQVSFVDGAQTVDLAFERPGQFPWIRLVPAGKGPRVAIELVREDVYEILREPGQWTLEFFEVEFP